MTIGIRRFTDADIAQRVVPERKLTWLGRIGDYDYATYQGHEWAVMRGQTTIDELTDHSDELIVSRNTTEVIDGTPWATNTHHRAFRVEDGAYTRELEKRQAKEAARNRKPALRLLAVRQPDAIAKTHPQVVNFGNRDPLHGDALKNWLGDKAPGAGIYVDARPDLLGRPILDWLAGKGVTFTVDNGHLIARSPRGAIPDDVRAVVTTYRRLIEGWALGKPLACELSHKGAAPEAVGLVDPFEVAACAEHLGEERQP